MEQTQTWTSKIEILPDMPDDYRRHAYDELRRQVGMELFKMLEQSKHPAVVEISDLKIKERPAQWTNDWYLYPERDAIGIVVKVTPVEHRHVVMQAGLDFDPTAFIERPTFWRRLKYAVTGR